MSRYAVPVGFTLVAVWIGIIVALISHAAP